MNNLLFDGRQYNSQIVMLMSIFLHNWFRVLYLFVYFVFENVQKGDFA